MKSRERLGVVGAVAFFLLCPVANAQTHQTTHDSRSQVPLQPIADQVRQLESLLSFLGQPFSQAEQEGINRALANPDADQAVEQIESILDKHALIVVSINPECRVVVTRGDAGADLVQDGTRLFLVKVVNQAGVTAPLKVDSPNSGPVYASKYEVGWHPPASGLTTTDIRDRWAYISLYSKKPIEPQLSGFGLEYRILLIYSRDAGQRSAKLSFNVGQGTQDIGFRGEATVLFNVAPSQGIKLHVLDDNGQPTMAFFIFRDGFDRIYPNQAKRLAPDFYFEPQVYRADGEFISLPAGSFTATFTGGPEYMTETQKFTVDANGPHELTFHLKRWINPADHGWYSGDHHVHAAGCSHYDDPTFGVLPQDMGRQVFGEHLNVASVLTWGPCYYYQKQFFRGRQDNELSKPGALLHYDIEVSGFPSSYAGHLVLLNLADQDYPKTKQIEDWPSWDLPILRWAKSQGATVGFAHSGWGLALQSDALPNYEMPGFDGIGANEFIVDVTYPNTVDFIAAGDTPYPWELNIWYQTLNVGFRTRIAGETDFPCIYDSRVGMARTYAKVGGGKLTYSKWQEAIRDGESYVSDGRSHLMNLTVSGIEIGTHGSEVNLPGPAEVQVEVNAAAYLNPTPDDAPGHDGIESGHGVEGLADPYEEIRKRPFDEQPYWSIERARIGDTRKVPVEVILNGEIVARKVIDADGSIQTLKFSVPISQSSWIALRILPSSHTNPIFIIVGGKPIRASRRSAEWCLAAVDQCWSQKSPRISQRELPDAEKAYEHARQVYRTIIDQSKAK